MGGAVGDRDLKNLPHRIMNLIDGSISSYCSIINSPKLLYITKQANKLEAGLGDI